MFKARALAACVPAAAIPAPTVVLKTALLPEQLGVGTTIKFAFSITYPNEAPVPLRVIKLRYPANLGIGTSGLASQRAALRCSKATGLRLPVALGHGLRLRSRRGSLRPFARVRESVSSSSTPKRQLTDGRARQ
jgi:hypothetical protein